MSHSPAITFLYGQVSLRGVRRFEACLRRYRALIDRLNSVRVQYLTTRSGLVTLAEHAWPAVFGEGGCARSEPPTARQVRAHFGLGRRVEQAGLGALTPDERTQWASGDRRFGTSKGQPWYGQRCTSGALNPEALRRAVVPVRVAPPPRCDALVAGRWYPLFSPLEARHDTHQAAA